MALLNPPDLRPAQIVLLLQHLDHKRGGRDSRERLLAIAGPLFSEAGRITDDLEDNLAAAVMLKLVIVDGDSLVITDESRAAVKGTTQELTTHLRRSVLATELSSAPWGRQTNAKDLTSGLAWLSTLSLEDAPQSWDGEGSASSLLLRDFGPRRDESDDESDWPIMNGTRWGSFWKWAGALGFAWRASGGKTRLLPDPSVALRGELGVIFEEGSEMPVPEFVDRVGSTLPVLDGGTFQREMRANSNIGERDASELSASLSLALVRLRANGDLLLKNRDDVSRARLCGGEIVSHVALGGSK